MAMSLSSGGTGVTTAAGAGAAAGSTQVLGTQVTNLPFTGATSALLLILGTGLLASGVIALRFRRVLGGVAGYPTTDASTADVSSDVPGRDEELVRV